MFNHFYDAILFNIFHSQLLLWLFSFFLMHVFQNLKNEILHVINKRGRSDIKSKGAKTRMGAPTKQLT